MSDPTRLAREPSSELEATLLRAGRARAPEEARKRALLLATSALAASGVAAGASGAATAGGTVVKGAWAATLHWVGIAGLVGAGAVTAAVAVGRHNDVRTRNELATTATESASVTIAKPIPYQAPVAPQPSAPSETPAADVPATARPTVTPVPEPASRFGAELSTLEQARAALSAGNPARALSILDDYATRFPHASMAPEATVLRIEALVRAGDAPAARRVADAFLAANPGSPYGDRIRSLVGTNP